MEETTQIQENKMAKSNIPSLIIKIGLPMVISMVLQALYNIVDTAFVINMPGGDGINANLALTYAFPIQILLIAIGVGTGIGINTLLSKTIGEKNKLLSSKIAGNGIFLAIIIYFLFLLFGIFGSHWFISLQAGDNISALTMGSDYLLIVSSLSFGAIGYTVYERFLQSSGKTLYSTISQIVGALLNIILDYIFIYPLQMGVVGAAIATVIGQCASLICAMGFHYFLNKDIDGHMKYIAPSISIIKQIYIIGIPAMIMQGLLSIMMLGMNLIIGNTSSNSELLLGTFGIYYKIQQFALFALFGLSNALITIISFNRGLNDNKRIKETVKYGIIFSLCLALIITAIFEIFANSLANLFALNNDDESIVESTTFAIRIASLSYVFMGISVSIQGLLQGLRKIFSPLIISLCRLAIFIFPLAYIFSLYEININSFWWIFIISESLTSFVSLSFMYYTYKKDVIDTKAKAN